jgi:hypothetical protein
VIKIRVYLRNPLPPRILVAPNRCNAIRDASVGRAGWCCRKSSSAQALNASSYCFFKGCNSVHGLKSLISGRDPPQCTIFHASLCCRAGRICQIENFSTQSIRSGCSGGLVKHSSSTLFNGTERCVPGQHQDQSAAKDAAGRRLQLFHSAQCHCRPYIS